MVERLQKAPVDQLLACVVLCHTSTAKTNANNNYLINELTSTEKLRVINLGFQSPEVMTAQWMIRMRGGGKRTTVSDVISGQNWVSERKLGNGCNATRHSSKLIIDDEALRSVSVIWTQPLWQAVMPIYTLMEPRQFGMTEAKRPSSFKTENTSVWMRKMGGTSRINHK